MLPSVPLWLITSFGFMLITDPQVSRLVHGYHQAEYTPGEDVEFPPWGRIKSKGLRRLHNLMEIVFGSILLQLITTLRLLVPTSQDRRFRMWLALLSPLVWLLFLGTIGWASSQVFGPAAYGRGVCLFALLLLGFFNPTQLPIDRTRQSHHRRGMENAPLRREPA